VLCASAAPMAGAPAVRSVWVRKREWFTVARHALLHAAACTGASASFQTQLQAACLAWLRDAERLAAVPASGSLEAVAAAFRALLRSELREMAASVLLDCSLQPAPTGLGEAAVLACAVDRSRGSVSICLPGSVDSAQWPTLAECRVGNATSRRPVTPAAVSGPGARVLHALGHAYNIQNAALSVAFARKPGTLQPQAFGMHPVLIEAALQVCLQPPLFFHVMLQVIGLGGHASAQLCRSSKTARPMKVCLSVLYMQLPLASGPPATPRMHLSSLAVFGPQRVEAAAPTSSPLHISASACTADLRGVLVIHTITTHAACNLPRIDTFAHQMGNLLFKPMSMVRDKETRVGVAAGSTLPSGKGQEQLLYAVQWRASANQQPLISVYPVGRVPVATERFSWHAGHAAIGVAAAGCHLTTHGGAQQLVIKQLQLLQVTVFVTDTRRISQVIVSIMRVALPEARHLISCIHPELTYTLSASHDITFT
jgi:hypothetical protein